LSSWSTLAFVIPAGISLTLASTLCAAALSGDLTLVWITAQALTLISAARSGAHGLASILIIFLILIVSLILISRFLVCHNTLLINEMSGPDRAAGLTHGFEYQ
jgi:hypothetical protein